MATPRKRITFQTPVRKRLLKNKKQSSSIKNKRNVKTPKNNKIDAKDGQKNKTDASFSSIIENYDTSDTQIETKGKKQEKKTINKTAVKKAVKKAEKNGKTLENDGGKTLENTSKTIGNSNNLNDDSSKTYKYTNSNVNNVIEEQEIEKYLDLLGKKYKVEKKLIEKYKKENEMLRNLKKESFVFKKYIGLEIKEVKENVHEFKWEIDNKNIVFRLMEDVNDYNYELVKYNNVYLPEALEDCINFEKCQLNKFFLNMYEILIAKHEQ
ncbi:hypothetical protein BDAP_001625 [Binucleata daphniae]